MTSLAGRPRTWHRMKFQRLPGGSGGRFGKTSSTSPSAATRTTMRCGLAPHASMGTQQRSARRFIPTASRNPQRSRVAAQRPGRGPLRWNSATMGPKAEAGGMLGKLCGAPVVAQGKPSVRQVSTKGVNHA